MQQTNFMQRFELSLILNCLDDPCDLVRCSLVCKTWATAVAHVTPKRLRLLHKGDTAGDQRELTDTAFQVVTWLQQWRFLGRLGHVHDLAMVNEEVYEDVVLASFFSEIVLICFVLICQEILSTHMLPIWSLLLQHGCWRSTSERGKFDFTPTTSTSNDRAVQICQVPKPAAAQPWH